MAATAIAAAPAVTASHRRRPGLMAWLVLAPLLLWLLLFVVVPTLMLVALSFGEQRGMGTIYFTFSLDNYANAFEWDWLKIFLLSIWYAFLTTVICMVVGYPVCLLHRVDLRRIFAISSSCSS